MKKLMLVLSMLSVSLSLYAPPQPKPRRLSPISGAQAADRARTGYVDTTMVQAWDKAYNPRQSRGATWLRRAPAGQRRPGADVAQRGGLPPLAGRVRGADQGQPAGADVPRPAGTYRRRGYISPAEERAGRETRLVRARVLQDQVGEWVRAGRPAEEHPYVQQSLAVAPIEEGADIGQVIEYGPGSYETVRDLSVVRYGQKGATAFQLDERGHLRGYTRAGLPGVPEIPADPGRGYSAMPALEGQPDWTPERTEQHMSSLGERIAKMRFADDLEEIMVANAERAATGERTGPVITDPVLRRALAEEYAESYGGHIGRFRNLMDAKVGANLPEHILYEDVADLPFIGDKARIDTTSTRAKFGVSIDEAGIAASPLLTAEQALIRERPGVRHGTLSTRFGPDPQRLRIEGLEREVGALQGQVAGLVVRPQFVVQPQTEAVVKPGAAASLADMSVQAGPAADRLSAPTVPDRSAVGAATVPSGQPTSVLPPIPGALPAVATP